MSTAQKKRSSEDQLRKRKSSSASSVEASSPDPASADAPSSANVPPIKRSSKPSSVWTNTTDSSSTTSAIARKTSHTTDPADREQFQAAIEKNAALGYVFSTPSQRRRPSYIRDWDGTAAYAGCRACFKWLVVGCLVVQLIALVSAIIKEYYDLKKPQEDVADGREGTSTSRTKEIEYIVYFYIAWMGLSVGSSITGAGRGQTFSSISPIDLCCPSVK